MDLEQEFKKETGFDAYIDNNLEPKIPMGYYVEWLEEQIEQLRLLSVVKSFSDLDGKIIPTKYKVTKYTPNIDVDFS